MAMECGDTRLVEERTDPLVDGWCGLLVGCNYRTVEKSGFA